MGKPYELSGEATPNVVENIDRMFRELYDATANATHAVLSATHSDSTPSAVARGSIITGQGAPAAWTQLVLGTGNKVLRSDGVDASWAAVVLTSDVSGILPVANGGTAIASYAIGDLIYASAATVLSKLADVAAGSYLRSGGVTTAPLWSTLTLPNTAAQGDIVYANAANALTTLAKNATASRYISNQGGSNNPLWDFVNLATGVTNTLPAGNGGTGQFTYSVGDILYASTTSILSRLPDVAVGNVLISGGVGVAPAWGKVALTTHVSGVLPEANGGTNQSTYASGDLLYASAANTLSKLAKTTDGFVLTLASGLPSWAASAGGGGTNALLDGTNHTDTLAGTVVRGDIIIGNSTPKWSRLAKGSAGAILKSDGTDIAWATKIGCRATPNATQSVAHNTNTAIAFQTEDFDYGPMHDNAVNNTRFTVPAGGDGLYALSLALYFTLTATSGTFSAGYRKNGGTAYVFVELPLTIATEATMSGSSLIELVATDYIEFIAYQFTSGGVSTVIQPSFTIGSISRVG